MENGERIENTEDRKGRKKIAVIFPGIGYHTDKPLLYYSRKIAQRFEYEIKDVPYGGFAPDVKGSQEKMAQAFYSALSQAREMLKGIDFRQYADVLFISKSVGTAVAAAYAKESGLYVRNVYYTPVAASFALMEQPGIVFSGTADTWVESDTVKKECARLGFPLHVIRDANHSLETGDVGKDLDNLRMIMEITRDYIERI